MAGSAFLDQQRNTSGNGLVVWLGVYRYQLKSNRPIINRLITFEIFSLLAVITPLNDSNHRVFMDLYDYKSQ
jgi:hypothetical protein